MAAQVQESNDFFRILSDVGPCLVLAGVDLPLQLHLLGTLVKPHDFLRNAASPPVLGLVLKVKHLQTSRTPPVVHYSFRQHTDQCRFATINVSNDSNPYVVFLPHLQR